jgi:transposase
MGMDKEDGRTLSAEAKIERRKQIVRLHQKGLSLDEITRLVSASRTSVYNVMQAFKADGKTALKLGKPGRKLGEKRQLLAEQELHIQRCICTKRPEQMKMEFALWSRHAVRLLIEQEFGLKLPIRTVGEYLKRWGYTPQRPIKRAYEQRPEAVKAWLDDQYPEIAKQAKAQGAEIHWIDETAVVNTEVRARGYAPKQQTPVAHVVGGTRHKLSMISAVTNQGKARWMIIEESFNADKLIEFFEALIKDTKQKVFVIMDNLRVHHSKPVKAWLAQHSEEIQAFYLPSYSPQLNPDERLNADLKQSLGSKVQHRTKEKLRKATEAHMNEIEKNPERVKSYFQDPIVKYAA